ncbi:MAG: N-acetyl-gamma-glutamyl-phosphate reductase [Frankiaceae bacterium]|nr:N-acetyl-gamma-glutamyl-phosphate reductase [Frankiaceae bacterium]MBV9870726.1 N-acetyl-gamma-glutamyl-phosphate reductase [Frankiaceae bacterium]
MGMRTAIVGASGYAGGELLRLLAGHPTLEISSVVAAGNAGRRLGELHPQLGTLADLPLLAADAPELREAEVVFLAVPHGASAGIVESLSPDALVVDLGADFRLQHPADWSRWYGGEHAGTWPYGLPELSGQRERLVSARRIANPGCYATAVALGLAPLLAAGVVAPLDIVVVAGSGTTGAGRNPTVNLLGSEVMGDLTSYKTGGTHQHLAEIRQTLGAAAGSPVSMSFTPMLVPMPRGILATCTARVIDGVDQAMLRAAFDGYAGEPFVTLLPEGQQPRTAATTGSNSAHLNVVHDADAGRAVVVVAIDNLGKGAAGQAIQNANLALGLDETAGLPVNGVGQ